MRSIEQQVEMLIVQSDKLFESGKIEDALKVNEMITELMDKIVEPDIKLTEEEAAARLNITTKRLGEYRRTGKIQVVRHSRTIFYYKSSDVDAFEESLKETYTSLRREPKRKGRCGIKVS